MLNPIELEMKSDSETGEKIPSNRRSSTASYLNYHFLGKNEKKMLNKLNNGDEGMDVEESPSFLSKIPIIRHLESKRPSQANLEISEEQQRKLEESIQDDLEKKKELLKEDVKDEDIEKITANINPATKALLNNYRRESVNIPYMESFFADKSAPTSRKSSIETVSENKLPKSVISNIIPRRNSEQLESIVPPEVNNRRRNSTAAFVNYAFLNKDDRSKLKKKSGSSDNEDTDEDSKSSFLAKISILNRRRSSNPTEMITQPEEAKLKFEQSIQDEIEKKKELLRENIDDKEAGKIEEILNLNLNSGTKALLNKYRRESLTLPYADSFFLNTSNVSAKLEESTKEESDDGNSKSDNPHQTISAKTMELHNKFKKEVTSPINSETINIIEELPPLETKEVLQLQVNRKSSFLKEKSPSSISINEKPNETKSQKRVESRSPSRKSEIRSNSKAKSKENVFKKLKSKLKEKLDF